LDVQNKNLELEALRTSDETAFDALFRRWYAPLCHFATPLTDGDPDTAEDVVQQAFIKLWEQRERLEIRYSVKAYLYKSVQNACLNRIRDRKTAEKYKQHHAREMEHQHDHLPDAELSVRIQKAISELPTQCRRIFELSRFEDLKYREIAEQLDISPKTVENQMGRALALLRVRLAEYLVTMITIFSFYSFLC